MKKQVVRQALPHLWRGALLLVLLFALIQVMPLAFGQRSLGKMAAASQAPDSTGAVGVVTPAGQAVTKSQDNTLTSRSGTPTFSGGAGVSAPAPGIPNDSWAVRAPMPYPAEGPFAVSDGNVLYVGGGGDGTNIRTDLLKYDPVANTFTPPASSPDGHSLSQAVIFELSP